MKETIGTCDLCHKSQRYLEIEADDYGDLTVGICRYGCDDPASQAKAATELVQELMEDCSVQLKKKLKAEQKKAAIQDGNLEYNKIILAVNKHKKMEEFIEGGFMDWEFIMITANSRVKEIEQEIQDLQIKRQTAKCKAQAAELEDKKRGYQELYRYAKQRIV